jgi:hypothetical protein
MANLARRFRDKEDKIMERGSEGAYYDMVGGDVGGTTSATPWRSMADISHVTCYVELGTWNAGDDLDHCRIEQATDSSGTSSKELTTDASGGDYDTDSPLDADGDFAFIEIDADDLDVDNSFDHIRFVVGEDGNQGDDFLGGVMIRHSLNKKAQLNGAASTGSKVYVAKSP